MKKILLSLLVMTFMILVVEDANAQRRGKKKRRVQEDTTQEDEDTSRRSSRDQEEYDDYNSTSLMDKLNFEIKPGNIFISSITSLSIKANAGYKINKTFSTGLGGKYFYNWFSGAGGYSDYGAFVYARAKLSQEFYLVAEYNTLSLGDIPAPAFRNVINYPAAGIGYMRPGIDWSSGFELLVLFSDDARNALQIPLEYWLNFSYNF